MNTTKIRRRFTITLFPVALAALAGCQVEEVAQQTGEPRLIQEVAPAPIETAAREAQPPSATPQNAVPIPARLQEVIQLVSGGVGDEVVLAFIQNSPQTFNLNADQIVYARDLGISEPIIAAMITYRPARPYPPASAQTAIATNRSVPESSPVVIQNIQTWPYIPTTIRTEPLYQAQTDYDFFYSSLAPYGSWSLLPEFGWSWQPTVAVIDRGWRPYFQNGRWLLTNHGWYWHSEYTWGWAPFHYGRWHNHPLRGWVWVPDRTWGPAWVTWRFSDDYCGWAPLPPGATFSSIGFRFNSTSVDASFDFGLGFEIYNFVPTALFIDATPWKHRVPPAEVARNPRRTTVVNNFFIDSNNLVVNNGIDPGRISTVTRNDIRRVNVRELPADRDLSARPDQFFGRDTDVIYRPRLLPPPTSPGSRGTPPDRGTVAQPNRATPPATPPTVGGSRATRPPIDNTSAPRSTPPAAQNSTVTPVAPRGVPPATSTRGQPAVPAVQPTPTVPPTAPPQNAILPAPRGNRQTQPPTADTTRGTRGVRPTTPLPGSSAEPAVTPPAGTSPDTTARSEATTGRGTVAPVPQAPAANNPTVTPRSGRGTVPSARANQPARNPQTVPPNTQPLPSATARGPRSTPAPNGTAVMPLPSALTPGGAPAPLLESTESALERARQTQFAPQQPNLFQPAPTPAPPQVVRPATPTPVQPSFPQNVQPTPVLPQVTQPILPAAQPVEPSGFQPSAPRGIQSVTPAAPQPVLPQAGVPVAPVVTPLPVLPNAQPERGGAAGRGTVAPQPGNATTRGGRGATDPEQ